MEIINAKILAYRVFFLLSTPTQHKATYIRRHNYWNNNNTVKWQHKTYFMLNLKYFKIATLSINKAIFSLF